MAAYMVTYGKPWLVVLGIVFVVVSVGVTFAVRWQMRSNNRRTRDRQRVDAVVRVEALVFVGNQQVEVARIDILHGRRKPPPTIDRRVGPQQLSIAIDHDA